MKGNVMRKILLSSIVVVLLLTTIGCAAQDDSEPVVIAETPVVVEEEKEPEPEMLHFGDGPLELAATNATGMTINRIQFSLPEADDFADDDALANVEIPDGEEFIFAPDFPLDEDGEIALVYDMRLSFSDGTVADLSDFLTEGISDLYFLFEDDVAFLEYHDDVIEETVSTKESELSRIAEAQRLEEERRAAEAAATSAPAPTPVPTPAPTTPAPTPAPAPAPAPAPDVCIEEPILRY